jgi:peptidoglycan hydrolase CwlO-like protein
MTNTNYPSANEPENRTTVKKTTTTNNNTIKNIAIGVLAALLLGTWGYFLKVKNESDDKIQLTQTTANNAMSSRDSVQLLYNDALSRLDSITGNNNELQGQLSSNQSEITSLKNEINAIMRKRNATASELARAKTLIATLNSKIANLEAEVARLTGEKQELASANTQLSAEKQTLQTNLQTTTAEKDELAGTVDVASTFSASNIQVKAIDERKGGKEKETTTAKKVNKLVISFDVENRVARTGPADIYVIVTAPDGKIIQNANLGSGMLTTRSEGERPFTFKSTMEYERGTRKNVQVPLRQNEFNTGSYRIEIYQNGFKIAEAVRNLRKGGLFG